MAVIDRVLLPLDQPEPSQPAHQFHRYAGGSATPCKIADAAGWWR